MKTDEYEEPFIPKTKHKFLKILLAIILIGAIGYGGYYLYQDKFNNPKSIVKKILEQSNYEISNTLSNEIEKTNYKVNGVIKVTADLGYENKRITDIINNIDFQFIGEIDSKNSIANIDFNTKYKGSKLIDLNAYFENKITYILLEGIYDKYLIVDDNKKSEIKIEDFIKDIKINSKNINILLNGLSKAYKEELTKYDFKQEKNTITVDDKDIEVLNNYIILKNNDVNNLASAIIKNLSNNSEFVSAVSEITNSNGKNILDSLSNDVMKNEFVGTYRVNFYTDRGLLNKQLVSVRQEITQYNMTTSINVDKIEDGIIVSTDMMGTSYSIKIKKNNSNFNLNLCLKMMEMYVNLDVSMNYEKINEVKKPNISNSKKLEDLTESEINQINEALNKNEVLNNLLKEIEKAFSNIEQQNSII